MEDVSEQLAPSAHRPLRSVLLVLTVAAALLSLFSLAAILVEYFALIPVWPPLMAVGLWGLPAAFLGMVAMVLLSVRDRRKADAAAALAATDTARTAATAASNAPSGTPAGRA